MLFALFFFLIGGTFLATAIASILLPFLSTALNIAATGLLVWNAVVLLFLLVLRFLWKRAGRLERRYIQSFSGWKRWALQGMNVLLAAGVIWEISVILACAGFLILQPIPPPLNHFP